MAKKKVKISQSVYGMQFDGLTIMTKRADFLKTAQSKRQLTPGFNLQIRKRMNEDANAIGIRVGFTCSKKVGNAVARNRAKRRLREIVRLTLPTHGQDGYDYVLIGKRDVTASRNFALMRGDLERSLSKAHAS